MMLYVYLKESRPVGFTVLHSALIPLGAITSGFYLTKNNTIAQSFQDAGERWVACEESFGDRDQNHEPSWRIYWDGKGVFERWFVGVPLVVSLVEEDFRLPYILGGAR